MTRTGRPSSLARASAAAGSGTFLDLGEGGRTRPRPPPRAARASFDERVAISVRPARASRSRIAVGVLVAEDRRDDDVVVRARQPLEEPVDGLRRVGAVAHLAVAHARAGRRARPPPRRRSGGRGTPPPPSRAPPSRTSCPGTSGANSSSGSTTTAPACATASFSRAISPRVSPSTSVCSSPTFVSSDDTRVEHVRRVEPAAEPRFDDRDVDAARGEVGERRRGQHLELRRPDRLGVGAHAGDRPLEPVGVRLEPLAPARDVRRRVRGARATLGAKQRRDRARRGRLALRADDVHGVVTRAPGGRGGRGARSCARARTRHAATARATPPIQSPIASSSRR